MSQFPVLLSAMLRNVAKSQLLKELWHSKCHKNYHIRIVFKTFNLIRTLYKSLYCRYIYYNRIKWLGSFTCAVVLKVEKKVSIDINKIFTII